MFHSHVRLPCVAWLTHQMLMCMSVQYVLWRMHVNRLRHGEYRICWPHIVVLIWSGVEVGWLCAGAL